MDAELVRNIFSKLAGDRISHNVNPAEIDFILNTSIVIKDQPNFDSHKIIRDAFRLDRSATCVKYKCCFTDHVRGPDMLLSIQTKPFATIQCLINGDMHFQCDADETGQIPFLQPIILCALPFSELRIKCETTFRCTCASILDIYKHVSRLSTKEITWK